jgi:DNA invertase Pin-like site-specific DNA recombinase
VIGRSSSSVKAGTARAKEQGSRLSRPNVDETTLERIRYLRSEAGGSHSLRWIAEEMGVGRGTVEKYTREIESPWK